MMRKIKKLNKTILLSALSALAFGGIAAGTTYALFTSTAETSVSVSTGKVNVTTTATELKTYSGVDLTGDPETDTVNETNPGTFTNGGTAKIDADGNLELADMTPGDKVTFKIQVKNNSTVGVKYRTRISLKDDTGLYDGLSIKIGESTDVSVSSWTNLAVGSEVDDFDCEVTLPSDKGNEYQGESCKISFIVEAVQSNAIVDYVTIGGIADAEGKKYATVKEAYDEISASLSEKCGLDEEAMSADNFNAFFTDGGKITWNIHGYQKVVDTLTFSFGRAAARFGDDLNITEINIVGADDKAELDLRGVSGTFTLPYNWWGFGSPSTALTCTNVTFDGIKKMPMHAYQSSEPVYTFNNCTFNGEMYSYQNYAVDMTIQNCVFNAFGKVKYAFVSQGAGGKITLDGNTFNNYTRGINLQRQTADFVITNNTIVSTRSESDRAAIQLTDGKSFVVNNNKIVVNAGNAFWFHKDAKNSSVTYEIKGNDISAPYLGYYATEFDVNKLITSSGNKFNDTDTTHCIHKDTTVVVDSNLTAIV